MRSLIQPMRRTLLLALAIISGCFDSPVRDSCTVECGGDGACPAGYACGADRFCHPDSAEAERACVSSPIADGSPADAPPLDACATEACGTGDELLPCSTWDGNSVACDTHGLNDPDPTDDSQDCGYYACAGTCRPRWTSFCEAGCTDSCLGTDEDLPCTTWNGDQAGCELHGDADPDTSDSQHCSYRPCSGKCLSLGAQECSEG
jgi:hypothetical protein